MSQHACSALLATILIGSATAISARDIFVDNLGGDDRNNGSTPDSRGRGNGPCRTLAKAMRLCNTGDRIILAANEGVPYTEPVAIQGGDNSGYPGNPLQIIGNGAVLDGSLSLADAPWEGHRGDVFKVRPRMLSHQVLLLDGKPAQRVPVKDGRLPELQPLQWSLFQGEIYFRTEPGRIPASYNPACGGDGAGITLYEVHDVVLRDLTVRGFQLDGVNAHDTAMRVELINVTATDNGRSGFSIGGASRVLMDGCTAAGNGVAQIRTEGFCDLRLRGGAFDEATAPALVNGGGKVIKE